MKNKRLFSLLEKLNKKELKSFEKFLASPYYNTNTKLIQLFRFIQISASSNYESETLKESYLHKKLFPDKGRITSSVSTLFSKLTELLEEFLVQERLKKEKNYKNRLLLQTLVERGNLSEFGKTFKKGKSLEKKQGFETTSFHDRFLLDRLHSHYLQLNNRTKDVNLQVISDHFDTYYLLYKMRLFWEMMVVARVFKTTYHYTLLDEVLSATELPRFRDNKLLQIFKQVLLFMQYPNDVFHFENFMQLLRKEEENIVLREKNELYILAANYCIQKVRSGEEIFRRKLFDIYKEMIEKEVLFISTYLDANRFKNILSLGCRYHEWDWTKKFIDNYALQLEPSIIDQAKNFAYGSLFFYKKDWDKAHTYLTHDINIDVYFIIDSKVLSLKCYYELGYFFMLFPNTTRSFKKFIDYNKVISPEKKSDFKNFISLSSRLANIKENRKQRLLPNARKAIETTSPLSDRPWLLEKIEELEKKMS